MRVIESVLKLIKSGQAKSKEVVGFLINLLVNPKIGFVTYLQAIKYLRELAKSEYAFFLNKL